MKVLRNERFMTLSLATLLLGVFLFQAIGSMRLKSVTHDETTHIASGYAALMTGDLRLNPQHPPLVKMLAALPLLIVKPQLDLNDPAWALTPPDEWAFGRRFLFNNDTDRMLFWARFPIVILGALMCCYVFCWARDLWGLSAGLFAMALAVGCPNLIAHSRVVTMDIALACFSVMTCYHLRRFLLSGSYRQLIATAASFGLALASKFSAVVLGPIIAALVLFVLLHPPKDSFLDFNPTIALRTARLTRPCLIFILVTIAVVWASYLFPSNLNSYFEGMQLVNQDHRSTYANYLNGQFRVGGWWYYFIAAFFYKTRAAVLLLIVGVFATLSKTALRSLLDEIFLALPPLVFLFVTSFFAADIGIRYILMIYPFLFISLARITSIKNLRIWAPLGLVLAASIFESALIYPHHLSFFNAIVGGPENGHELLDDSNIDWGQDFTTLAAVMNDLNINSVKLYTPWLGSTSPEHYGISWAPVSQEDFFSSPPPDGVYAVSTHLLIRGELWARQEGAAADWMSRYRPFARAGYSFYLFRFPEEPTVNFDRELPKS